MKNPKVLETGKLGFSLKVINPFIACMHHKDQFPTGNGNMEPVYYIKGWQAGSDFNPASPWRMYHGDKLPGFPSHPHRGFETVTVVLEGFIDHSDSHGATGRYGNGDVQWMTAGEGLQHAEMFPLLSETQENPLELFQVWLNLPSKDKFVEPYYKMLWNEQIPDITETDENGRRTQNRLIAGRHGETESLLPNPNSWAANRDNHVGIQILTLEPYAHITLPKVSATLNRMLYFYEGAALQIEDEALPARSYAQLSGNECIAIQNGPQESRLLILEGEPINEPVVSYGPFVMNTQEEIAAAYNDYQRTRFGGWPWEQDDPVNPKEQGRFARYKDGSIETPTGR